MINFEMDLRRMQYNLIIDREEVIRAMLNQDNYNDLICRISKLIYEEMRRRL